MLITKHFKQRILISAISIIGLIICIYYSHDSFFKPLFILLNAALISMALKEYFHLTELKGFNPLSKLGIGAGIAYLVALGFTFHHAHLTAFPSLILLFSFLFFFVAFAKHQTTSIGNLAVTVFGLIYLVIPLSCIMRINYFFPPHALEDGRLWLAYTLIVTKMTDIGGYFCGKTLGKTKLAPLISPKKTVEGALGGIAAALFTSMLCALFLHAGENEKAFTLTIWQSIWVGLLISILAQLGDLAESLLKRDAGVKDSSHLPGLGGVLDIVDSLVFTLPLMYLLMEMQIVG